MTGSIVIKSPISEPFTTTVEHPRVYKFTYLHHNNYVLISETLYKFNFFLKKKQI